MIISVQLHVPDTEAQRLGCSRRELAEGVAARIFPVAGCDPDEFLAAGAIIQWHEDNERNIIRLP